MVRLGAPEYGVTECIYTYNRVKITATYEKVIEIDVDDDFDKVLDDAFDNITLSDLDYDWNIIGEETETVYVR